MIAMEFRNHQRKSRWRTDQYAVMLLISSTRLNQLIVLRRKFLILNIVLLPRLPTDTCNPEPPPSLVIVICILSSRPPPPSPSPQPPLPLLLWNSFIIGDGTKYHM